MMYNTHKSLLPTVKDVNELSFWQALGVSSMLVSCHVDYSKMMVLDLFELINKSIKNQELILFFNHENKPTFMAVYSTLLSDWDASIMIKSNSDDVILFENIISPFSSPIHCYRFLKFYCQKNSIPSMQAYVLALEKKSVRKIW
ncbi:hypothetical protein [Marinomonas algicola]|uniref:hypothetical protein n=1 Tax=Marinomonas algicola TaxID=2773454 RepID=UPI00174AA50F|nr:hypothetical protein [Marinomonas algicola]